ncbi:hypothetical protein Hanom_Chr00s146775g01820601 [Helianthus anomalus]
MVYNCPLFFISVLWSCWKVLIVNSKNIDIWQVTKPSHAIICER